MGTGSLDSAGSLDVGGGAITQTEADTLYAPVRNSVWISTDRMATYLGSAQLSTMGSSSDKRVGVYLFDGTASEGTGTTLDPSDFPTNWVTYRVEFDWSIPTTDVGDVVWQVDRHSFTAGETVNDNTVGTPTAGITAPAQYVSKTTVVASGLTRPTKLLRLTFLRKPADAADTLTAIDVALIGVRLVKTS